MEPTTGARDIVTGKAARPVRFIAVGIWNTLFGYAVYVGCLAITDRLGVSYIVATVPAQILAILNAYACQRWLVFGGSTTIVSSFLRFSAVYLVLYVINLPLLVLLVSGFQLDPRVAAAILTLAAAAVSYVAHHRFTFRVGSS